jgi:hypothetical protein
VVLDALGAFDEPSKPEAAWRSVPDTLITFGAGTNQLASQKALADRMPEIEKNPVVRAVWAIFGAAGLSLWLYWNAITVSQILWGGLVVALFFLIQRLIFWAKNIFFRITLFAPLVVLAFFKTKYDLPITSIGWLLFTLFFIFGSIRFILSPEGKKIVQAPVSPPLGLAQCAEVSSTRCLQANGDAVEDLKPLLCPSFEKPLGLRTRIAIAVDVRT